jgi:hypothetical protein
MSRTPPLSVDFWFDPVCPYSWTASRWLLEVERVHPIEVDWHVMSLYALNAGRTDDPDYVAFLRSVDGCARVLAVAAEVHGRPVLRGLYSELGTRVFDVWRRARAPELRLALSAALAACRLPGSHLEAFDGDPDDAAGRVLRRSHDEGVALVGADTGTPITRVGNRAFYGPVLNGIPRGHDALRVFDATRLLAAAPDFYELKRTRTTVPVFT